MFLALLMLVLAAQSADAQSTPGADWPNKPIKLVVPFPAGSSTEWG